MLSFVVYVKLEKLTYRELTEPEHRPYIFLVIIKLLLFWLRVYFLPGSKLDFEKVSSILLLFTRVLFYV